MSTTVSWSISKHHRKADGTYNAKIRIIHNRKIAYTQTGIFTKSVRFKKGSSYGDVTDPEIENSLNEKVRMIRKIINDHNTTIEAISTPQEVIEYIQKIKQRENQVIDFIAFSKEHISNLPEYKNKTFLTTGINSLCYYLRSLKENTLPINKLTSKFLRKYESWLRTERTGYYKGKEHTLKPITDSGVKNYTSAIKILFNRALDHYNDYENDDIVIKHDPFKAYKIVSQNQPEKKKYTKELFQKIYHSADGRNPLTEETIALHAFLFSFFIAGINLIDMYEGMRINDGRIEYNRTKTRLKKKDKSFISIAIPEEAKEIINKHIWVNGSEVLDFKKRYKTIKSFRTAVCIGMKKISENVGFKLKFYDARHMFATFARNNCGFGIDDVAFCLTHSSSHAITETYITPDYSIVDKVIKGVLDYVFDRQKT